MIELKDLNAFYGEKKVLDNISMSFPAGKVTVILGPNGSGKTTLIKATLGLIQRKSGEILIDGKDIADMELKEIARKVAYLSQSRNIPSITAERMVLHGRFPHLGWPRHYTKNDHEIVSESMRRTGCEKLKRRIMSDLSGGERQKVYLAMALAQDTDTIFMDEPTTYLDPEHQLSVMERAKSLTDSGKTVIMVLHDLSLALRTADEIAIMKDGSVLMTGTPDEIYGSGILEEVFHVRIGRAETESGYHYWAE